jgi:putative ABC transport system substrate-binding protein
MRRREFIIGAGAALLHSAALSAQTAQVRRIGVIANVAKGDAVGEARLRAYVGRLRDLGWVEGQNIQLERRWGEGKIELYRRYAAELVELKSEVLLAYTSPVVAALQRVSRAVPIVFAGVVDPVGAGFVQSLARPRSNATGFSLFEYSIGAKWLELIRELSPQITRVGVVRESSLAAGIGQFAAIQALAPGSIDLSVLDLGSEKELRESIELFTSGTERAGLIVTASGFGANHPAVIPRLAAQHGLPAVYPFRYLADAGGLLSYGPDLVNDFRLAAEYTDRILRGEKPGDLPVQRPTRYNLVINLKSAKAIDLTVPPSLLARADEVIE